MENQCSTKDNTAISCIPDSRTPILYPVVIGAPETSISVDTETTSCSGSESESESEWTNGIIPVSDRNNVIAPASTINVDHSTDVVIGPMTQFHGPVTIYQTVTSNTQNHNGSIEHHKTEEPDNSPKSFQQDKVVISKKSKNKLIKHRIFKWVFLICIVLAVISAVVSVIVFLITNNSVIQPKKPDNEGNNNSTVPPDITLRMYTREEWRGKASLNFTRPLKHPTPYAVVSHTAGSFCTDFPTCSSIIRTIQTHHMQTKKEPDIGYNFLIGGDGEIYIGRGWDVINYHKDKNIEISIIGEYSLTDTITSQMISTLEKLLQLAMKLEKLAINYKIVCHNQIEVTVSPGKNVCKEVAKFSHYYPGWVTL